MDRNYVSEFTVFMNQFLQDHPEVVEDQIRGWNIFWNPRGDQGTPKGKAGNRTPAPAAEREQSG